MNRKNIAAWSRTARFSLSCLTFAGLTLVASRVQAITVRPTISPIPDQRFTGSNYPHTTNPLAIIVDDSALSDPGTLSVSVTFIAKSGNWASQLTDPQYTLSTNANDHRIRTLGFTSMYTQTGSATVIITATSPILGTRSTSFILERYSGATPPSLEGIPDVTMKKNGTFSYTMASVNDANYGFTGQSSNTNVASPSFTTIGTPDGFVRRVNVTPVTDAVGTAVMTVTLTKTDQQGNILGTNVTSFVVDVINENGPSFSTVPNFLAVEKDSGPAQYSFTVTAGDQGFTPIKFSATSSNSSLVKNDPPTGSSKFLFTGPDGQGNASVQITPETGIVGATTVTLTATDGTFPVKAQFLFVVKDSNASYMQFARPRGFYVVDGPTPDHTLNPFGYTDNDIPQYRDANIVDALYIDGYVLRVPWKWLEDKNWNGSGQQRYDFSIIDNILTKLSALTVNPNEKLSIIFKDEPDYIDVKAGQEQPPQTWFDSSTQTYRAVPWYSYMQTRWQLMLQKMKNHPVPGTSYKLGNHPGLAILNPGLPGVSNGIRDPGDPPNGPFVFDLDQDTVKTPRTTMLSSIESYLTNLQNNFTGKFVHIGFWSIQDDLQGQQTLTEYLRSSFVSDFDGNPYPLIGLWEDNVGAGRATGGFDHVPLVWNGLFYDNPAPYVLLPDPSFATPLRDSKASMWTGFQSLGSWMFPLNDSQMVKDANGTPNDAFEGSYSTYYSQYWEVYHGDALSPRYIPGLQRWHDYLATLTP